LEIIWKLELENYLEIGAWSLFGNCILEIGEIVSWKFKRLYLGNSRGYVLVFGV